MIDLSRVLPTRRSITVRKDKASAIRARAAVYERLVTAEQSADAVRSLGWIIAHAEMALYLQTSTRAGARLVTSSQVLARYGIEELRGR